jgi:hypothetical protein
VSCYTAYIALSCFNTLNSPEWSLFLFLEQYLQRLEGPLISQVWPRFMQLAKEMAAGAREAKLQAYATLR